MAIDPKLIDDLNSRRKKVILSGGQEKIDKRHEKGEMTARDRMGYLFEEGTFSEIGHACAPQLPQLRHGQEGNPRRRRRFRASAWWTAVRWPAQAPSFLAQAGPS